MIGRARGRARRSIVAAGAPAPAAPTWLSDVMALPGMITGGSTSNLTTGIQFTVPSSKTLTGVRAYWIAGNTSPIMLRFRLYDLSAGGVQLRSEDVSHTSGLVQTTGAFGTQSLSTSTTYAVSVWNAG